LRADEGIDYTQQSPLDACKSIDKFDGVIDSVGEKAESDSFASLKWRGIFVEI